MISSAISTFRVTNSHTAVAAVLALRPMTLKENNIIPFSSEQKQEIKSKVFYKYG